MKSKYCFLRDVGHLVPGSFVYVVWVGSSLREFAKRKLVEEFCRDNGIYFEKWDDQVNSFLDEKAQRFRDNGNVFCSCFAFVSVTISELYSMIIDDSFDAFEAKQVATPFEVWMRCHDVPEYVARMNHTKVIQHASPSRSKNLSLKQKGELVQAVACMVGVLILFMLDVIVSHLCNFNL